MLVRLRQRDGHWRFFKPGHDRKAIQAVIMRSYRSPAAFSANTGPHRAASIGRGSDAYGQPSTSGSARRRRRATTTSAWTRRSMRAVALPRGATGRGRRVSGRAVRQRPHRAPTIGGCWTIAAGRQFEAVIVYSSSRWAATPAKCCAPWPRWKARAQASTARWATCRAFLTYGMTAVVNEDSPAHPLQERPYRPANASPSAASGPAASSPSATGARAPAPWSPGKLTAHGEAQAQPREQAHRHR